MEGGFPGIVVIITYFSVLIAAARSRISSRLPGLGVGLAPGLIVMVGGSVGAGWSETEGFDAWESVGEAGDEGVEALPQLAKSTARDTPMRAVTPFNVLNTAPILPWTNAACCQSSLLGKSKGALCHSTRISLGFPASCN